MEEQSAQDLDAADEIIWKLILTDRGGALETPVAVDVIFAEDVDLAGVVSIEFKLYVPEELAGFFFGRNDVRLVINGENPRWQKPAIEAGWNSIRWELKDLYTFPQMQSLRIHLGHFMPGFETGTVYLSDFSLNAMETPAAMTREALEAVAVDEDLDWTQRFQAIRQLQHSGSLESIEPLLKATANGPENEGMNPQAIDENDAYINPPTEGSEAVRSAARQALAAISLRLDSNAYPRLRSILERALRAEDPRTRLAVLHTISELEIDSHRDWMLRIFDKALLDDIYYVRSQALSGLARLDRGTAEVATGLARRLKIAADDDDRHALLRCLSELGPAARQAMPEILTVLRDESR